MDGIILIDKKKNVTSRDVVNCVCQKLHTKKVGHTGTLDPLATGLLVICVNEGCKLVEILTGHDKEYVAKVHLGYQTDTLDITGHIVEENQDYQLDKEKLENVLASFIGEYMQTVPIYSSIKVNGKKLYEYARAGLSVELPRHLVRINKIKLLDFKPDSFTFFVSVSSGTYIRSLIDDIGKKMNILMTMEELRRTKVGHFNVIDASSLDNLQVIPLIDCLDVPKIEVDDKLVKKVSNGVKIDNLYNCDKVMFTYQKKVVAIYEKCENNLMKSYRVFKH